MIKEERKSQILELVNSHEIISIDDIAAALDVSKATVRRDIDELAVEGTVEKTRGGIMSVSHKLRIEPSLRARSNMNVDEKGRMAEAALKYVRDNEYIVFDSGTTVYELVRLIRGDSRLTAVTYDLLTALELAKRPQIDLLMIGGFLRKNYFSTYGFFAEGMLKRIRVDKAFLSADAVDLQQGIMGYTSDDIRLKQMIVEAAGEVILMCDHSKFSGQAFINICDLKKVSRVITGRELAPGIVEKLISMGITVERV